MKGDECSVCDDRNLVRRQNRELRSIMSTPAESMNEETTYIRAEQDG